MSIEANGVTYETDEEGYLVNLAEWNEDVAKVIAQSENVDMTPSHWEVVNFLRDYYNEYQIAPAVRVQVPLRAVPLRPRQAGLQDRGPAQADRLRLTGARPVHRARASA
jgi:TusE/DsrC/DsvC family sulfur relay protein